ncbi:MAG: LPS export ABC transporter permease LptG [Oxalobacteraceae bacterium]|jgi:lipopolysaccharide export system permease protein|nr:LPS export ABC transporter permease LptG [Oxalobacteraceae bacterium]
MRVLRRYFTIEICRAVFFVLVAFLALFAFFDMMGEIRSVGRGAWRIEHAFIYVTLGLPAYAYELMPIVALIGTIYVMAQLAARSEFTVMRASSLSMGRAIRLMLPVSIMLVVLTFVIGEFVAPRCSDFAENFKRRIMGAAISSEFRSGLWAKDVIRGSDGKSVSGSRFLNAKKVETDGVLRSLKIYEFDREMQMMAIISSDEARFVGDGRWQLSNVEELRFAPDRSPVGSRQPAMVLGRKFETTTLQSEITPEIMAVLVAEPNKMSAVDLAQFSRHLEDNKQRSERYEIALWTKLLYPLAVFVMMALALPFAYLQSRSGGVSLKIFIGIMIGVSFHLLNNLFSHVGLLNTWPPLATAVTPSACFLLAAISALWWVERH